LFKKSRGEEASGSKLTKRDTTDAGRNLRVENERVIHSEAGFPVVRRGT
jgi:hypothetical protein